MTEQPESRESITDADVIAAIHKKHKRANISGYKKMDEYTVQWDDAWVDPGGTIFGPGPYLKVPIHWKGKYYCAVRVYAPERLRRSLAERWIPDEKTDQPTSQPESEQREYEWWCPSCRITLPWDHVTHEETHDVRVGGCGAKVTRKPAGQPESDRVEIKAGEVRYWIEDGIWWFEAPWIGKKQPVRVYAKKALLDYCAATLKRVESLERVREAATRVVGESTQEARKLRLLSEEIDRHAREHP